MPVIEIKGKIIMEISTEENEAVEKIKRIQKALNTVDLKEVLELTKQAIKIAFPNGIPNDEDEKNNLTYWQKSKKKA